MKKIFSLCLGLLLLATGVALARNIQVTDALGRKVTIKAPVERAVFYIGYEFIPYLDLWEQTVGLSLWAFQEEEFRKLAGPHLKRLKPVGTATHPNLEALLALKPDLVLTWTYQPRAVNTISALGVPVVTLAPEGLCDLFKTLDILGRLFGKEKRAKALEGAMKQVLKDLQDRISSAQKVRAVFMWNRPTRVSGKKGVVPELIRAAGGKNMGDELSIAYADVSLEHIVMWNPEVIFIWGNARFGPEDILKDTRLSRVEAVRTHRVYKLPSWSTWSPRAVLLAVWMAKRLHPDKIDQKFFTREEDLINQFLKQ